MYNGVHSESEEGHGEAAAVLDPRGEHDSVSYNVVYEDVVEVVVVEPFDAVDEMLG